MTSPLLISALNKMGSFAEVGTASAYKLGTHPAYAVAGVIPAASSMSHAPIYGEAACVLIAHDAVCWISFSGVSRERARELLMGEVKLPGEPARPLVPAGLLK